MTWREELKEIVSGTINTPDNFLNKKLESFIETLLEKQKEEIMEGYEKKINELGYAISGCLTIPQIPEIGVTVIAQKYNDLFLVKETGFGLNPKEGLDNV